MGRASARKRPAARATTATTPEALAPPILPRSVQALSNQQRRLFDRLAYAEIERRKAVQLVDSRVLEGRAAGLPWSVLAYALGTSSQAVSKKYGPKVNG